MSGGSFNYLYSKEEFRSIIEEKETIESMSEHLKKDFDNLDNAIIISYKLDKVFKILEYAEKEVMKVFDDDKLKEVLKAVEYYYSADYSKDQAEKKIKDYKENILGGKHEFYI